MLKRGISRAHAWVFAFFFGLVLSLGNPASAQQSALAREPMDIKASVQNSYGRIILTFSQRTDMPGYDVSWDNGVLVIAFDVPVRVTLPDLSDKLPDFVSAARVDPDGKGLRIGLKAAFKVNKTEAGEHLFIDLLPQNWQGVEPGLPREIVETLSQRAKEGILEEERRRRAAYVLENAPEVKVHVGRHPTFLRLLVEWSVAAQGEMVQVEDEDWQVHFDWPVPIDVSALTADLPTEIVKVSNAVDGDGSTLDFRFAEDVVPRFYAIDEQRFALDVDLPNGVSDAVDLASILPAGDPAQSEEERTEFKHEEPSGELKLNVPEPVGSVRITPYVENVGKSVRIVFPFENDTAAAVFRRGETLWMIFDTRASIGAPEIDDNLKALVREVTVQPAGETSVVRLGLVESRLATMASEGRSWVLSLGGSLLNPAELITLNRRQTSDGLFEMVADIDRPSRVHELRDPEVGDLLSVVTAFPPARGIVRDFDFVDFTALRSVHGLVVQPTHDDVTVEIESKNAIIRAERGLIVSAPQLTRPGEEGGIGVERDNYVDLLHHLEPNPDLFVERRDDLMHQVAEATVGDLETVRFDLARLFLANQFHQEAIGLLRLIRSDSQSVDTEIEVAEAAAQTMAGRWDAALEILGSESVAGSPDALVWRTIARAGSGDFSGARRDALVAELSLEGYPDWVHQAFLLAASEAALEEEDIALANRLVGLVDTGYLDRQALSHYEILAARLDEAAGRFDEALDTLGQVIAADIRPTRAEAVYRTMLLLDKMGRLDLVRATETLASEVLVWRGDELEASMLKLLAELYFRNGKYREAFETVRALAEADPEATPTQEVLGEARQIFADLYLNGEADGLLPLDALTLYYDFRAFTPVGARGDEMVRNLARRLIKFDLLEQAAELLQYQVDERLEGAAKAQIAADLAVVYLAQRQPKKALLVLNQTRVAGVAPGLERQRRILEARAMIDANREDLAIDLLNSMDGRDADLLRVDAHWRAKRYGDAAEIIELLYSDVYNDGAMPASGRANIIKAAVGFVLARDTIGIGRLRERFSEVMVQSPEWPLFDFVTGQIELTNLEFKRIAKDVVGADTLNAFLATYNDIYGGEGALSLRSISEVEESGV